ncbi:MAG: hypothetical protein N2491_12415 [Negativicutes bacterium]|nr:hypothetical protein [Negativicutes bacterium]
MTGTKMQPEFNRNLTEQVAPRYEGSATGGVIQDRLREEEAREKADAQVSPDLITDKFSDNAGDNALTRYEINQSLKAPELTNEHLHAKAFAEELNKVIKNSK